MSAPANRDVETLRTIHYVCGGPGLQSCGDGRFTTCGGVFLELDVVRKTFVVGEASDRITSTIHDLRVLVRMADVLENCFGWTAGVSP